MKMMKTTTAAPKMKLWKAAMKMMAVATSPTQARLEKYFGLRKLHDTASRAQKMITSPATVLLAEFS